MISRAPTQGELRMQAIRFMRLLIEGAMLIAGCYLFYEVMHLFHAFDQMGDGLHQVWHGLKGSALPGQ